MKHSQPFRLKARAHLRALRKWAIGNFWAFTTRDLHQRLVALGLVESDVILVHSSFDSFAGFTGKATDVIATLQNVVGSTGVIMMPTMTFLGTAVEHARANPVFDVARTPSRMGLLSELFRRSPGVVRSVHPTHPVAIWGRGAADVAAGHHLARTPCGEGTPFDALRRRQGKILLLGTGIGVLTYFHLLEEVLEADLPVSPFTREVFHLQSRTSSGEVVDTRCRLFEPSVSRRRRLERLVPRLKAARAWREARVGRLKMVLLPASAVEEVVRNMHKQGVYCYE